MLPRCDKRPASGGGKYDGDGYRCGCGFYGGDDCNYESQQALGVLRGVQLLFLISFSARGSPKSQPLGD